MILSKFNPMLSTPETPVMIVCLLLLASLVFIFAFAWGNLVLQRHREYKKFKDTIRPDCVAAFCNHVSTLFVVNQFKIMKQNITPQIRRERLQQLKEIRQKIPSYQTLLSSNYHLVLESFLTESEILSLKIAD
jgi:hypothetical protein